MRPPIKYAQRELGVSETDTKRVYCNSIVTVTSKLVKNKTRRIHHSQKICDPDGVVLKIVLEDATVSITDKNRSTVKFSPYLVPELRASLLEVEEKFALRFIS
jgi:hypothetical protein